MKANQFLVTAAMRIDRMTYRVESLTAFIQGKNRPWGTVYRIVQATLLLWLVAICWSAYGPAFSALGIVGCFDFGLLAVMFVSCWLIGISYGFSRSVKLGMLCIIPIVGFFAGWLCVHGTIGYRVKAGSLLLRILNWRSRSK